MPQLTIDLNQLGLPVADGDGWVETVDSMGNPIPIAANAGTMVLGSRGLDFSAEGVATITLPSTDDLEPAGARYRVYITRRDTITAPTAIGPFALTTNANLDEVAELPPPTSSPHSRPASTQRRRSWRPLSRSRPWRPASTASSITAR